MATATTATRTTTTEGTETAITGAEAATTSAPDPFLAAGRLESEAARAHAADLFARHGRMVEALCRGLLRDSAEAEDAAQQTFLAAYRALIGGTEPREPSAWLAAIARNECLARIRSRMREPLPVDGLESEDVRDDPLAEALRRADLAALWTAIGELPRQQREALLLREFGGLSYGELAVALGVSGPAVESLLFRARTRVRGRLKEAFASVGWLSDALARLLSAGGAAKIGSVPVVAKVVTAGVGVAVVAGTAVVGERQGTPSRPNRTHHGTTVQRPAAPEAAPVAPAVATPVVRHLRATKLFQAADERSVGHQGQDGETGDVQAARHDRAAEHVRRDASEQSGDTGEGGHHASAAPETEARHSLTLQNAQGDGSGSDESNGSDHSSNSGSGEGSGSGSEPHGNSDSAPSSGSGEGSGSGSEPHGNSDSAPSGLPLPPGVTQVTGLLPQDGRGLPAGE